MCNLKESLDSLQKALEASDYDSKRTEALRNSAFQTIDLLEVATPLLSEKAIKAISNKSASLTHNDDTGNYVCVYLGVRVRKENINKGVSHICKALNTLAELDLIHSCVATPTSIDLAKIQLQAPSSMVFCFVLVPVDKKEEAEKLSECAFSEGNTLEPKDDLEVDLKEGEFLAKIDVSNFYHFYHSSVDPEESLNNEIQAYLNILPKGTEVVEIVNCAIISLSSPYEIRFRNPLMANYKQVKLNYRREAVKVGEDKIEQFNLLTDVEYIKKNGK